MLEEIVGEINDEYDKESRSQIKKDGEGYILDGMLAVRDANQRLGLELPEDSGYTTIAGFVLAKAGQLLKPGEQVEDVAGIFRVERVDRRRITRIRFLPAANQGAKRTAVTSKLAMVPLPSVTLETLSESLPIALFL